MVLCFSMEVADAISELEHNEEDVRFSRLIAICKEFFGEYRTAGSHHIFKTPWPGDPRINLQQEKRRAKAYQVRQVVKALKKLQEIGG